LEAELEALALVCTVEVLVGGLSESELESESDSEVGEEEDEDEEAFFFTPLSFFFFV
jgi:hypothetical protein